MTLYDPYMPEIKDDPMPVYARLRKEEPVYYIERFDAWALAAFDDIWAASEDGVHFSTCNATSDRAFLDREPAPFEALSNMDLPEHLVARKPIFPLFGPRAAKDLAPSVREWTRGFLDEHESSGRIDAVEELARQVAVRVACRVSGFSVEDSDFLLDIVTRFFRRDAGTEGLTASGTAAMEEVRVYLEQVVRDAEKSGKRDAAAGRFFDYTSGGDGDPIARAAQHLILVLFGATDTFPKVFASALLRFWQYPDQRREMVEDPSLIPGGLHEVLRYDTPTQWLGRTVVKDTEIKGHKLTKGQPVLFLYPSANRDENEFEEPDRFDIHRNAPRILTFGHGVHRCLGAFMAKMEGRVMLEEVLSRYPEYEVLEEEAVWPPTEFVRGYSHFPIVFEPR